MSAKIDDLYTLWVSQFVHTTTTKGHVLHKHIIIGYSPSHIILYVAENEHYSTVRGLANLISHISRMLY